MIYRTRHFVSAALLVALIIMTTGSGLSVSAQQRAYRANEQQVGQLLRRIDSRSTLFRQSLEAALNQSRFDTTRAENNITGFVRDFEAAAARLRERFNQRQEVADDAREVLNRAAYIDGFMQRQSLAPAAERNWIVLRSDLNLLARYHNVAWNWNNRPDLPGQSAPAIRLTGTYRLDAARSDNVSTVTTEATRELSPQERQRLHRVIMRRLESPEMLGIERNGRNVTIASTRAPQITFEADGRERTEQTRRGRSVTVNATLNGDQLVISSTGDRGNDYTVSFDPIENGRRLRVTRRIDINGLSEPVTVNSVYSKTSEVAQLNLYRETPVVGEARRNFIVPDGTQLFATLNNALTTRQSREGDRFTLTVQSPSQYQGAVIEGYLSQVDRAGQLSGRAEVSLNFERIRLRNGATYNFDGYIESVRTPDGEDVRVDNEGNVSERDSQTGRTLGRTGIGAAIGAVIGAIAGGGKGAAIGAAIGAGAGAGSVFVQGRDDLELMSGTQFTIHARSPRREEPQSRR